MKTTSIMNASWFLTILAAIALYPDVNCDVIRSARLKIPSNLLQLTKEASDVNNICPDYVHQCTGTDPCCVTPIRTYTCCPYPYGSCCSDGLHCCPYGMVCYGNSTCLKSADSKVFAKIKTLRARKLNDITCQDKSTCDDESTCCQLASGGYGCCPLPNAVCCSDKIHCCPQNTICDTQEGVCLQGSVKLPFL